jgi:hypothetical protein
MGDDGMERSQERLIEGLRSTATSLLCMKTKVFSDSEQKIAKITKNFAVFAIFCSK